ncbi:hypothetical protein LR48_Vigan05g056400 [Vigna angularis]|uniref:Uncharacterized protein n=1 Tax=Phaseolus angularis TaxID=3914 RepID=A0A0L9UJC3_PHAAN|nr:hypothetical protein LR48_Vigan05g056400 [Vigna angularis]
MAIVHVESSSESSGKDGGRVRPLSGPEPNFPAEADKRIIYEIPFHLLKGGILVDGSPLESGDTGAVIPGYDWEPHDASLFASEYATKKALSWRVGRLYVVRDVEDQLCVRVQFTEFQMVVLREMNVAPVQLHLNSWAVVQAFLVVSLTFVRDRTLFLPFSDSYKNFKDQFFKVIIDEVDRHEFHDATGNPLFPFHWTRNPRKIKAYMIDVLSPVDLEVVRTINALPHRLSARNLVECLRHEDCEQKAFDVMSTPPPRKSNFMASRKGADATSSTTLEWATPTARCPPLIKRSSSTSRIPTIPPTGPHPAPVVIVPPTSSQAVPVIVLGGTIAAVGNDPLTIFVDPSSEAATTFA